MNGQNLKIAFITVRCLLVIGCCLTYFLELPKWNLFFSCGTAFIYCTLLASNFMLIKLLTGRKKSTRHFLAIKCQSLSQN
jgi:hypothetical protein